MVDRHFALSAVALASALAVIAITPARSDEVVCNPLALITKQLAQSTYHEAPIAKAIGASGVMLIVYAAADGATWTMIGVKSDHPDIGCWLATGTDWTTQKPPPPGRPS